MNWLVKEEPKSYSFDTFMKDGGTRWSGVRNPLAQRHLREMRKGDRVLYYHTGAEKAVVGTARAASDPAPDPADRGGKRVAVDLVPVGRLPQPVTLAAIRGLTEFAGHPLVRMPRLSVMPVTDAQWRAIERMAKT
jgi:predicted RNA-binding protein with PUA-like domain